MAPNKHGSTHKYRKMKLGDKVIWKCMLPNCPHYVFDPLVIGRLSVCWRCGKDFYVKTRELAKPTCCKVKKKVFETPAEQATAETFVQDFFGRILGTPET